MIKRYYSPDSRRMLNVIWNAAGRYDFEPSFLAFHTDGEPDFYFNIIIGLAEKWLDMEKISAFFDSFAYARESDEYSEYVWLDLESCLYHKELPERPVLTELRKAHAEAFFRVQQQLSKQQMEVMSMGVYTQQQARWAEVTGRRLPAMSAREQGMYEALNIGGACDTDEVIEKLKAFITQYCGFDFDESGYERAHKPSLIRRLWGKHVHSQYKNTDRLIIRSGSGTGDPRDAVHLNQQTGFKTDTDKAARDRAYIEGCFGKSLYREEELKEIERELCVKEDAGCRLWFTDVSVDSASDSEKNIDSEGRIEADYVGTNASAGTDANIGVSANANNNNKAVGGGIISHSAGINISSTDRKEIAEVRRSALEQRRRNEEYFKRNSLQIRESIRKLSSEIEVLMSTFLKHLPERAEAGRIVASRAYRAALFNDSRIFLRDGDETENNICIDILLDASQSRMNSQELIAAEAYVLAESMRRAAVPVQVAAFRSLRGYTVIERLKAYDDKNAENIFGYFASGWNRDALAIKGVGRMIRDVSEQDSTKRHILLILTDASPNDSTPIAPCGTRTKPANYEGLPPVEAAESAVKELKREHIHTAAVFHGATAHLENAYRIYGKEYIRIRSLAQLSAGFTDLMQSALQEMEAE